MSKRLELRDTAEFVWFWSDKFFLITDKGNFIWSDPGYGGDNTIVSSPQSYGQFCEAQNVEYGRAKGTHVIGQYCGPDVKVL